MKRCSTCEIEQPAENFNRDTEKPDGLKCYCRTCQKKYNSHYHQNHREQRNRRRREYHKNHREEAAIQLAMRRYKIPEDIAKLKVEGRLICQVCGSADRLHFDHNHETGEFRGILCHNCNVALGYARESREVLLGLAEYIGRKGR
jgi:Recombination endonuclease VII